MHNAHALTECWRTFAGSQFEFFYAGFASGFWPTKGPDDNSDGGNP
ncbi:MAG: hypothetical protein KJ069_10425 [Anaerolineae bacterium]|nr:hypothetical protein [Anaerolineae bacterium]